MAEACQRAAPTIKQYLEQAFAVTHELENRLTVLVKYTFRKEIAELKGDQPMKYGRGTVEYATLGLPGKDMPITVPTWMRLDVTLDATFELKKLVEDTRRGPDQPVGFAVPWKATLSFVGIKSDFDPHYGYGSLDSVTMSFICPDGTGTVRHPFSHSDCWMSRHQPRQPPPVSLAGTTYSECCEELGIFREAYVYVKYHILWREFIRMSLRTIQPSLFDVECLLLGDRKAVTERVVRARVANVVMPVAPGTLNLVSIDGKAYSVDIPVISAYISPTVLAEFERQTAKREVVRVPYPAWLIEAVIVGLYDAVWPRWKKVAHLFLLAKFAKEYGVKDIAAIVQLQLLSRVLDTCLSEELFDPVALDSELFTWSFFRIHKFWYFQKRLKSEEKSWKGVGKVCNLSKQ